MEQFQIVNFYEFKQLGEITPLLEVKERMKELMIETGVRGTIILAEEGYNASLCGTAEEMSVFMPQAAEIFATEFDAKISLHNERPLRKIDVKIKPEIVTLKQPVDISLGAGTHVKPEQWNEIISDEETFILDTRNDYEYKNGTFRGAVNPETEKFSDLPAYIAENLDPEKHKRVAMFCTGGIRCEKFAPYMKGLGFDEIYQLEGGILRYIETVPKEDSLWDGECFVFDERRTLTHDLEQGVEPDHSLRNPKRDNR